MLRRIFLLSLQQALRSVALFLFPLAFITLFAWATAGSSTGNTSDPVRAALWLWLGSHLIPFKLSIPPTYIAGSLTYLPIGAAIFPFLALRNSYRRLISEITQERAARICFVIWYSAITVGISVISHSHGVKSVWYFALGFSAVLALLSTVNYQANSLRFIRLPSYLLVTLWGVGAIFTGISLISHFAIVKDLTTVIQPGWVGGVLFLLLQVLYLPNLALSAISYLFGIGFSLGNYTLITPFRFTLHEIPAIPILASLPTGRHPIAIYSLALGLVITLLLVININRNNSTFSRRQVALFKSSTFILAVTGVLAYLNSGSLITSALSPIGTIYWKLMAVMAVLIIVAAILGQYIPATLRKVRNRD